MLRLSALVVAGLCFVSSAIAQDAILDAHEAQETPKSWGWIGDFRAGYDHVSGVPNNRDDISRLDTRVRAGAFWNITPEWEAVGLARATLGTDTNKDNRRNNDNERSDGIGLDQLAVRWKPGEATSVTFGKAPFPLDLSPMVWDADLRPAGVALDHSFAISELDRLQLVAGYFAGQHLYGDESRIGAVELAWRWHEGAPTHIAALLSYLDFSDLGEATREGLARTNTIANGELVNGYRLVDVQLVGHSTLRSWPIEARFDYVNNLGADDANHGVRGSLVAGDRTQPGGWEFGAAAHRIQKDAVMAAFNSDDWWFHSAVRGQLVWIGYGLDATWNLRLAGFHERRDGLDEYTDRVRVDLTATW
ncbi:MAG: hypothetical protein ABW186_16475 [Rhodanobacteraceae bacterium]